MRIQIDRDLPVPVSTQVQGQVEYGVSTGDFPPGSRLPSVRDLALELGVSPVTVSQVYRVLRTKGLIETAPERGTFVGEVQPPGSRRSRSRVDELLALVLGAAEREGRGPRRRRRRAPGTPRPAASPGAGGARAARRSPPWSSPSRWSLPTCRRRAIVALDVRAERPGAAAYRLREDHPGLRTAVASLRAVYGVEPWLVGMGGSVPICETFQRHLGMDTVFFSFAVGDEDIHAPNEFFRLRRFAEGRRAWADYLTRLPREMARG
jgi:DNA-binding transcriptional regulator YhcF (GntR family)